jgi:peroxiredoxin Q/BCP
LKLSDFIQNIKFGEKMRLEKGQKAPDFTGVVTGGSEKSLSDYSGKKLVLYFYPKDDTPGCTKEACAFRDTMDSLTEQGVSVLGVSPDDQSSHDKFIAKYDLNFDLLSDPDNSIATSYGAYGEKNMYGKTVVGIIRSTFLIDEEGTIVRPWYNVRVNGHVDKVKEEIDNMG